MLVSMAWKPILGPIGPSNNKVTCLNLKACPLVICYTLLLNMAIDIVDLPINNGDLP